MPLQILRGPEQAPLTPLIGKTVAVLGFGNQGHAHALNLRESGVGVMVAARANGRAADRAASLNFSPTEIPKAVSQADLVIIALPDEVQPRVYREEIEPNIRAGSTLGFLHGFNIHYGLITPHRDVGVVMVAPKGPGATLRERFVRGLGIPCLFALHQDSPNRDARAIGLAWANAIGCARAAIIVTTFRNETETDLFGEQAVLCGGMTGLVIAAFETLVAAGYPPELAYLECCHEVKQIADLVYERGLAGMMEAISNTAEFGAYHAAPMIADQHVRDRLKQLLGRIQDGSFAKEFSADFQGGFTWFKQHREALKSHSIEPAGQVIRSLMPKSDEHRSRGSA